MAKRAGAAERLRTFVAARVRKDGSHYVWGNAARLAEHLEVSPSWVTEYTDTPPTRHADLDQAVAICQFYGVDLASVISGKTPKAVPVVIDPVLLAALQDEETAADVQAFLKVPAAVRKIMAEGARLIGTTLAPPQVDAPTPAKARGKRTAFPAAPRRASGRG
jgi:hypothetical protein